MRFTHSQANRLIASSLLAVTALNVSTKIAAAQQPRQLGDLAPGTSPVQVGSNPDNFALVGERVFFTGAGRGPGTSTESIRVYSLRQDGSDLRDHGRIDDPATGTTVVFPPAVAGSDYFIGIGSTGRLTTVFAVGEADSAPRVVWSAVSNPLAGSFTAIRSATQSFVLVQGTNTSQVLALRGQSAPSLIYSRSGPFSTASSISAAAVGSSLVFSAPTAPSGGYEPWITDGTAEGTAQLATLAGNLAAGSQPSMAVSAGGRVVFEATGANSARGFYSTDGTAAGTTLLATYTELGVTGGTAIGTQSVSGRAFVARSPFLVVTDGTTGATARIDRTASGTQFSGIRSLQALVNGRLVFAATTASGTVLCSTDGTIAGTEQLATYTRTLAAPAPSPLQTLTSATLVLTTGSGSASQVFGLIRTDGTAAGTTLESAPLNGFLRPGNLRPLNIASGQTVLGAWLDPSGGTASPSDFELWITNNDSSRINLLTDVLPPPADGGVRVLGTLGAQSVIASGGRPYAVDANGQAATAIADLRVTEIGSAWAELSGGALLAGASPENRLFFTQGSPASTHPVFQSGAAGPVSPGNLARVGDLAFFTDTGSGSRLWKSNGTEAGTTIVFTDPAVTITDVTAFAGQAWFFGRSTAGIRLYRTDGTTTTLVPQAIATSSANPARFLGATASQLFVTTDSSSSVRSFTSDGSSVTFAIGSGWRSLLVDSAGLIGILENPQRLVRWPGGFEPSVVLSSSPTPPGFSVGPAFRQIGTLPGKIIFTRYAETTGEEVYAFQESTGEAQLLRDVLPGAASSSISKMQTIGNRVYWVEFTPGQGRELWSTDGTPEGTHLVTPVNSTDRSSVQAERGLTSDDRFALVGSLVLFGADDGSTGEEPWVVALCPADFNSDGESNPDDMAEYISAFFAVPPQPAADIDSNGAVDPDDLADFISVFFGGCD